MSDEPLGGHEIDPFDATASILRHAPAGPMADYVAAQLQAPASRGDLIDIVTAQAHMNVTLVGAILAVWQRNDGELTAKIEALLSQSQQMATKIGNLTSRSLNAPDPYVRQGSGEVE